jgi:hypothetical protein
VIHPTVIVGFDGVFDEFFQGLTAVCGAPGYQPEIDGSISVVVVGEVPQTPRGGVIGTTVGGRCPENQVVVGLDGRAGLLVDQIVLQCAPILVDGATISFGAIGNAAPFGGEGGVAIPEPIPCPAGALATGAVIRAGDAVDAVGLRCSPLPTN